MYVILVLRGHPLLAWDDRRGWPPPNPQRLLPGRASRSSHGHIIRAGVRRARAKLEKQQCLPDP